ncbi:hypothetical protein EVAR_60324_1 [Eumeta japonica]|uniref:Uncharacterized protein n=1 Tax=Eumeta variegata TaxID=151549 RepID=A0A4C1ZAJ5_EUMVA|nr:hypothetical protein EVAR_60324_1 [Eumeta japonica]
MVFNFAPVSPSGCARGDYERVFSHNCRTRPSAAPPPAAARRPPRPRGPSGVMWCWWKIFDGYSHPYTQTFRKIRSYILGSENRPQALTSGCARGILAAQWLPSSCIELVAAPSSVELKQKKMHKHVNFRGDQLNGPGEELSQKGEHKQIFHKKYVEAPNTIATPSSVATGNVSYGIPSDIAQIGEPIEQVVLDTYPKQHNRASDWFKRYKWLQYSVEKDAAFAIHASNFYLMEANRLRTLPQDLETGKCH